MNANDLRDRLTLSVAELAETLKIGRSTAYALVNSGDLPVIRAGGAIRIPAAHVRRMLGLEELPDPATTARELTGSGREQR